jgi:CO/xanthine dehydrogenase Mo-binding subunit
MAQQTEASLIGRRIPRSDAREKVMGRAVFGIDFKLPGMLHARPLLSEHAHARILSLDTKAAEELAGVRAVVTAADLAEGRGKIRGVFGPTDRWSLARGKVRFAGEPVAVVAAETEERAAEAVKRITVAYEPLPILLDPEEAVREDSPWIADAPIEAAVSGYKGAARNVCGYSRLRDGDVEAGFREADLIHEDDYETNMVHQGYIEPTVAVVRPEADGGLTIWANTQIPFHLRMSLAQLFALPLTRLRVIATYSGGAFGGKATVLWPAIACLLAKKAERPVRLALTRVEEFQATFPRHPTRYRLTMGVKRDGTITALKSRCLQDTGGYAGEFGPAQASKINLLMSAPYRFGGVDLEAYTVLTNKADCGAFRAPLAPQTFFALESHMDAVAEKLGLDALEFRLRNAREPGEMLPSGQALPNLGLKDALKAAGAAIGWGRKVGPNRGLGLATGLWYTGGTLGAAALVKINEDGTVALIVGGCDTGSGAVLGGLPLIVAEELGVDPGDVFIEQADTALSPWDGGSVSSRTTYSLGNAVIVACQDARQQLLALGARQLGVPAERLELRGKVVRVASEPERAVPLAALSMSALVSGGQVLGRGAYVATKPTFDPSRWEGLTTVTTLIDPSAAVHAVEVEVDRETGRLKLLRYVAAQDVGRAINPLGVEGQIEGGASQGIGQAIFEDIALDGEGRVQNPTLLDYRLPSALDIPRVETIVLEGHTGSGPYGAKGVGEPPHVPPLAAIANAVARATGVRVKKVPLSPENIWRALSERPGP